MTLHARCLSQHLHVYTVTSTVITASTCTVYAESSERDPGPDPQVSGPSCGTTGNHGHPCGHPLSLPSFLSSCKEVGMVLITGDVQQTRQTSSRVGATYTLVNEELAGKAFKMSSILFGTKLQFGFNPSAF